MTVDDHYELSGAVYPFSLLAGNRLLTQLREAEKSKSGPPESQSSPVSTMIMHAWLAQYLAPPPMPTFLDAHSGQPILLITDHYHVNDWDALAHALKDCPEVEGDKRNGWSRLIDCADGLAIQGEHQSRQG